MQMVNYWLIVRGSFWEYGFKLSSRVRWVVKPREMGVTCPQAPMCIIKSGDLELGQQKSAKTRENTSTKHSDMPGQEKHSKTISLLRFNLYLLNLE
jgi:hypothetical protein